MSTTESRPTPLGPTAVEKFLGPHAASGGPFALLGVTVDRCQYDDVVAALDRQIARIDNHPQGQTPEADDVRLALHAAAAQLLDEGVRAQMESRWRHTPRPPATPSQPQPSATSAPGPAIAPPTATGSGTSPAIGPSTPLRPSGPSGATPPASSGSSSLPPPPRWTASESAAGNEPTAAAAGGSSQSAATNAPSHAFRPEVLAEARRLIAASGGWNEHARQRITLLASARGIPPAAVPDLIRAVTTGAGRLSGASQPAAQFALGASGHPTPAPHAAPSTGSGAPRPVSFVTTSATGGPAIAQFEPDPFDAHSIHDDHAARTMKVVVAFSIIGILVMAGAFWGVIMLTAPKAPTNAPRQPASLIGQTPEPERPEALFPTVDPARATPPVATTQPAAAPLVIDVGALLDEFRLALRAQETDPEGAASSFRALVRRAGAGWPEIPIDRRRAIVDAIVEYVYHTASSPEGPVATLEDIAAPAALLGGSALIAPDDVPRIAWSVGLLVRLQRERDISARAGSLIEARLGAALEGARPAGSSAFDSGVAACLGVMPRRLLPASGDSPRTSEAIGRRLDAWRRWLACVAAVTPADPAARATLTLSALDTLVQDAPQPTDDRHIYEAIGLLVEGLDWSDAGVARRWLVRMLSAPSVDPEDVHAITSAVATLVPRAGLDVSMVLPARATDLERRELRDRLAILWNLADPADQDALASAWREEWRSALDRHASDLTPVEHLATAIVLSRISEAASLRWRGMTQEADDLLLDTAGSVDAVLSAAVRPAMPAPVGTLGDATWADQYLQAGRSIPIRQDLLNVRSQSLSQSIGPVDAEILVNEAVRGSPPQVARLAYDMVLRVPSSPAIINALLEELPTIPKSRRVSALISTVTGHTLPLTRDARWEARARRALVSRLLELLAADSDLRIWDELARLLGWSYLARAEIIAGPPDPGATIDPPEVAAGLLRARWRRQGESLLPPPALGLTFDEIDRRRAARRELAQGPPQNFAAEQLASIELMSVVVAAEQPQRVDDVRRVLDDLAHARQRATHIAEQIAAGEAAGAALWGIRLKEGLP